MNNNKRIGNKLMVSATTKSLAINTAKEINDAATTGMGTTSISKIMDPNLRALMTSIENRIVDKSSRKINISKLDKILVIEESFEEELLKMPEIQAAANMKESLRFTYVRTILSRFGRATKKDVWNILSKLGVSAVDPGVNDTEVLKELASSDADYVSKLISMYLIERETREGKLAGGKPSILIDSACKNLNKIFAKKGIDAVAIAKPLKKDYVSRGLTKPYKGKKAVDVLIVHTDKKTGKTVGINLEYFGWTGISYEKNIVTKGKEIADNMEHQYGVFSPTYADNEAAMERLASDLYDKYGSTESSEVERRAYRWVLANDKYVAPTAADALYEGFYGILDELGLAKKVMPASKVTLFKR